MFSGIVETQGEVTGVVQTPAGVRLTLRAAGFWSGLPIGASIAVDGVCLTLVHAAGVAAEFDIVPETLSRTTLCRVRAGDRVNLERSLRADSRVDGHFVQGHVEGTGTIARVERTTAESKWWFRPPDPLRRYIFSKGSIAVDGISLTVVDATEGDFSVVLIPSTLAVTTLGDKKVGDLVNLETDMFARTIVHTLESWRGTSSSGLTLDTLRREGFA